MDDLCVVYITASGKKEARKLARMILSEKLAACVNICDNVQSWYSWNGSIENSKEALVLAKTRSSLFDKLSKKVKENHSYDLPCILAIPVKHAEKEYAKWVISETSHKSRPRGSKPLKS